MSFNYRVIRRDYPCGPNNEETANVYQIHEVYYRADGSIEGWSQEPIAPYGECVSELKADLSYLITALHKPVLIESNGTLVEERK